MDLRATIGLALIAAALVLGAVVLAAPENRDHRRPDFLSIPRRTADWLRLLLAALAALIVTVLLFHRFGYAIPVLRAYRVESVLLYPLALLGAGSAAALVLERRLGIVFGAVSALLGVAIVYAPAPG
jgi:hypothetical protein